MTDRFAMLSQVVDGGYGSSRKQRLRVVVVAGDQTDAAATAEHALAGLDVVGCVTPEDVVAAVDLLRPNVLVLEPKLAALAARLSSSPAGVVVAKADSAQEDGSVSSVLEIALCLSLACPERPAEAETPRQAAEAD